jgi:hypothetical protein
MRGRIAVHPVPRLHRSEARALAYLIFEGDNNVNVAPVLARLSAAKRTADEDEQTIVWGRFRSWIDGESRPKYHHGWDSTRDPEFSMAYVFRWDHHSHQHRRLYGFLTTPRPRFEVCTLCCFGSKDEERTDPVVRQTIIAMSKHQAVNEAVRNVFNKGRRKS